MRKAFRVIETDSIQKSFLPVCAYDAGAMTSHVAIDVGAESGRVMLGTLEHGRIQLREIHRFTNAPVQLDGSLRWSMPDITAGIDRGLAELPHERVTSIGVDTWGCDYGLVDADGRLLELPYHYRDHRTDGVMERVLERLGLERVYGTTGIQCLPFNTLYQLAAARASSSDALRLAHRVLTIPDLINHRLTGRMVCEFTNATTTQCIDARTGTWAVDLLDALDLPASLFGEIVPPGTILGPLATAVPASHHEGAVVVAPACHDTGSAFASVAAGGDTAFLSCGTWSLLGAELPAPVITPRSRVLNFTNEGGVNGSVRLLKNIGGLWLLQACRRRWVEGGTAWSYEDLVAAARDERHALRVVLDPDDPVFLNPADMPREIEAYCARTGQPVPDGAAGFARAIFEGLALKYRLVLDALEEVSGRSFRRIRMVGGGSRNAVLAQLTADATGRVVLAGPTEATALGNIVVQAVAVGAVASLAEARAIVDKSFPPQRYEPRTDEAWQAALDRLRQINRRD
jgi:rhamnulokinase